MKTSRRENHITDLITRLEEKIVAPILNEEIEKIFQLMRDEEINIKKIIKEKLLHLKDVKHYMVGFNSYYRDINNNPTLLDMLIGLENVPYFKKGHTNDGFSWSEEFSIPKSKKWLYSIQDRVEKLMVDKTYCPTKEIKGLRVLGKRLKDMNNKEYNKIFNQFQTKELIETKINLPI